MNLTKREFMQVLGAGTMAGMGMGAYAQSDVASATNGLYDIPKFGNVSFLHMTDCHAQLKPIYFREPSVNIGIRHEDGKPPHIVGKHFLDYFNMTAGSIQSHAFTSLDFIACAEKYGKVGGYAHLRTLINQLRQRAN